MQQIADWLKKLGMCEYVERFAENDIDIAVLPDLTDQHLKDLGVSLGHRLKMLRAIRDLSGPSAAAMISPMATEPARRDEAERRQLTIMFCDLVGSTALSARLDPEDLRVIISAYHRCCTELIERNGGFVAKYMGDGVLAYFGYPQAHEHDAERAVRAGLNLVEAVPKLATHAGSPLQMRVGIATGLVVVGDLIGAGAAQEQAVVGETTNLAARLQALAEPGAVVVASSTRKLTGGLFECRDLGVVSLKGFAENVPAWQVLGAGAAESRFEALRATTTPLIGRDEEIDLLMRRWEQARHGEGRVVLISGEPGIGKSRIAQTVVERITTEPHTRLRYFCSPHHQDSALHPSIAQLERAADFRREDTADQRLEKLEAVLAQGTNDLGEAVRLLADLLSIPPGDRYPPLNLTPQKRKEKTFHAQLAYVEGLAARRPVLIAFEDVHWSDPTTREWLDLLIDRVPMLRVMVILTFRPEFAPSWVGRSHVTMLILNRLPPRQRAEMIAHVAGGKVLPREVTDHIVDRTDGVPLFIEELTKAVVESAILTEDGDRHTATGPATPLAIPTTLHASLLARLDRLPSAREVAQIGAAIGRQFSYELITAVAPMPQKKIDEALAQLTNAELIFRRGASPAAEYTFKHALVQEVAYGSLLKSTRNQLHEKIARLLEERFPETRDTQPELLAHHYAASRNFEFAARYWLEAGRNNVRLFANDRAVRYFERALAAIMELPGREQIERLELEIQQAYLPALMSAVGFAEQRYIDASNRAAALSEKFGIRGTTLAVLFGQFSYRMSLVSLVPARELASQIAQLGEDADDNVARIVGRRAIGLCQFWMGDLKVAKNALESALALGETADHQRLAFELGHDPIITAQAFYGVLNLKTGYLRQGEQLLVAATDRARKSGHGLTIGYVLFLRSIFDVLTEDYHELERTSAALQDISERQHIRTYRHMGAFFHSWALGRLSKKVHLNDLEQELEGHLSGSLLIASPLLMMMLADAYADSNDVAMAELWLDRGLATIARTGENLFLPEAYLLKARFAGTKVDGGAECNRWLAASLEAAINQSAKLSELRTATTLAKRHVAEGMLSEARARLAPIYGSFTEGFDTPVMQDAKALLDQLG
jgi:class 3 adenylate cyclase